MGRTHLLFVALTIPGLLGAQKKPLDMDPKWPRLGQAQISADGRYVTYTLGSYTFVQGKDGASTMKSEIHFFLHDVERGTKREIPGASGARFSADGRYLIYTRKDTLLMLDLAKDETQATPGVSSFSLQKIQGKEWLLWNTTGDSARLILKDVATGKTISFPHVLQYQFSGDGGVLVYQSQVKTGGDSSRTLYWVDMAEAQPRLIATAAGAKFDQITFNARGDKLAFIISRQTGEREVSQYPSQYPYWSKGRMPRDPLQPILVKKPLFDNTILLYNHGTPEAVKVLDNGSLSLGDDLEIASSSLHFALGDSSIVFQVQKKIEPLPSAVAKADQVMVEVWRSSDESLVSEQQLGGFMGNRATTYPAIVRLESHKVIRLLDEKDDSFYGSYNGGYVVTHARSHAPSEGGWREEPATYLVSIANGRRTLIDKRRLDARLSPTGRYVLYFDPDKGQYFTYEVATGATRNISANVPVPLGQETDEGTARFKPALYYSVWLKDDAAVILGGRYDLWKIDPRGKSAPVSITNGYGRKHEVVLRILKMDADPNHGEDVYAVDAKLLLMGFDWATKDNGYFRTTMDARSDPEKLTMGAYVYSGFSTELHASTSLHSDLEKPVKAANADVYLVQRMSAAEAPNLFVTRDFRKLTPLTDKEPQKEYNWLTTQLLTWKMLDGKPSQGILYKPEDFDPRKRYPVIMWFYEKNSSALNAFPEVGPSEGDLNIPYFVSNGYLVFVPDVYYTLGSPGEGARNAIVSAGGMLAKLPYVDARKIGIQGHSWGGFEVNYVVTKTNMFAAAMSACGPVDFIMQYGDLEAQSGMDLQELNETGQGRMGGTPWKYRDRYISNSPLFEADKVETPMLLLYLKKDGIIGWNQATEWFTALRRLNKQAWMLQYDDEPHSLSDDKNKKDFTIRMKQFFDHYLKDAPAPKWMTRGIPARLKGIETGLELDSAAGR